MDTLEKIERLESMRVEMDKTRSPLMPLMREISCFLEPVLSQFALTDANKGSRISTDIIDDTATLAGYTLDSGLMSSVSSPSRPWIRLTTSDPRLSEVQAVKTFLYDVNEAMLNVLLKSNFYTIIQQFYSTARSFATAVLHIEPAYNGKVVRFRTLPMGSFLISDNSNGYCDCLFREMRLTTRQVVEEFGKLLPDGKVDRDNSSISDRVCDDYDAQKWDNPVDVIHGVYPNMQYRADALSPKHKRYSSDYWELGGETAGGGRLPTEQRFLRESGMDWFPFLVFRWKRNADDVWGTMCPGIQALPNIKQLQHMEDLGLLGYEKGVDPAVAVPADLDHVSLLPGAVIPVKNMTADGKVYTIQDIRADLLAQFENKESMVRDRINRAFFVDLFRQVSLQDEVQTGKRTATEVRLAQQESMRIMGPVLEILNDAVFGPMVAILWQIMRDQGLIPEPPEELRPEANKPMDGSVRDVSLKVEYISIMSQAMKLEGLGAVERLVSFVAAVASFDAMVVHKIKTGNLIDQVAKILSIPPDSVATDEEFQAIMDGIQRQQQAAMQAEVQAKQAAAVKSLGTTPTDQPSVLSSMAPGVAPGAEPPVGAMSGPAGRVR